jgi:hypothetical protein
MSLVTFAVVQIAGCSWYGSGTYKRVRETYGVPATPGARPPVLSHEEVEAQGNFPSNLDKSKGLSIGEAGVVFLSLSTYEIKTDGKTFIFIGIGLLLVGGLVAFYLKQYIPGAVVGGVGLFCLVAPTVLPVISAIVIVALLAAVGAAIVYLVGKYVNKAEVKADGLVRAADLNASPVAGDDRAAIAVLRTTDPAIDAEHIAKKAKRPTVTTPVVPVTTPK